LRLNSTTATKVLPGRTRWRTSCSGRPCTTRVGNSFVFQRPKDATPSPGCPIASQISERSRKSRDFPATRGQDHNSFHGRFCVLVPCSRPHDPRSVLPIQIVSLDPRRLPAIGVAFGGAKQRNRLSRFTVSSLRSGTKGQRGQYLRRAADSHFGGTILCWHNYLKSLVGAQGLEPSTR
jgi:hypothetical protein